MQSIASACQGQSELRKHPSEYCDPLEFTLQQFTLAQIYGTESLKYCRTRALSLLTVAHNGCVRVHAQNTIKCNRRLLGQDVVELGDDDAEKARRRNEHDDAKNLHR